MCILSYLMPRPQLLAKGGRNALGFALYSQDLGRPTSIILLSHVEPRVIGIVLVIIAAPATWKLAEIAKEVAVQMPAK